MPTEVNPIKQIEAPGAGRIAAVFYWRGRYIEFCDRCRRTHSALRSIPDSALERVPVTGSGDQRFGFRRLCALGDHPLAGLTLELEEE